KLKLFTLAEERNASHGTFRKKTANNFSEMFLPLSRRMLEIERCFEPQKQVNPLQSVTVRANGGQTSLKRSGKEVCRSSLTRNGLSRNRQAVLQNSMVALPILPSPTISSGLFIVGFRGSQGSHPSLSATPSHAICQATLV